MVKVTSTPKRVPEITPKIRTMIPCHKKTADASEHEKPIDLKMAISLVFSSTMIAKTLKIPSPDSRSILETVIADDTLNALKTSSQTFSRSAS